MRYEFLYAREDIAGSHDGHKAPHISEIDALYCTNTAHVGVLPSREHQTQEKSSAPWSCLTKR